VLLDFVLRSLVFISREEFQQLANVLYHDRIRQVQLRLAAKQCNLPPWRVRAISESEAFRRISRASLFVGMSDGARLDYIRRHNLDINNEQVIPYYHVGAGKLNEVVAKLQVALGDSSARFQCVFLIDDFCGSGSTLLREVVRAPADFRVVPNDLPPEFTGRIAIGDGGTVELTARCESLDEDFRELRATDGEVANRILGVLERAAEDEPTALKGSLTRVAETYSSQTLDPDAHIVLSPLLATDHAIRRLRRLVPRLPGAFSRTKVEPAATIGADCRITDSSSEIGAICARYYDPAIADRHTGSITFGYQDCGLPLVLHHNTPNNSLYLLWTRRLKGFNPLFVRHERHGRE
jgi:hypothetical protein